MPGHPNEPDGPNLTPWDPELVTRVQPVFSALFHDVMGPLTLVKNRIYLMRRHLQTLEADPRVPDDLRAKVQAMMRFLEGVDDAAHRIHRGLAVPRDAIWESVLQGAEFLPEQVIDGIGKALTSNPPEPARAPPAQV